MAQSKPKTTVKNKSTSGSKASAKKVKAPAKTNIQMIPLNKLSVSPKNVRKTQTSEKDDTELMISIRENGLKQNLAGYDDGKGGYLIDAGGRRLNALQQLAVEGIIANDHPVACLIEDESEAILTSTTENMQRAAMHPADEFTAFASMIDEGRSENDVALRFGVSVDLVRRRLKLARVAPEIFETFREGEISLECVMAFTLTDHHDRQITVWNAVKDGYQVYPQQIKRLLTETSLSASSKLGKFVGTEAYKAAGGAIVSDLFSDQNSTYFENPELVERLAIEKLKTASEEYVGQWKWVDVHLELEQSAIRSFGRVYAEEVDPDPELLAELDRLNAREEQLTEMDNEEDLSEELSAEYDAISPRVAEIEKQIEGSRPFADDNRALSGVILTIDWDGNLSVIKGLVRPEDIPAENNEADEGETSGSNIASPTSSSPVPVSDPASALRKADGMTQGLADDLRTSRHHIIRAHLACDYQVAFDVMLYTMCKQAFSSGFYVDQALDFSLREYHAANRDKLVADSVADKMLTAVKETLQTDWLKLESPQDFQALSKLPQEDKQALFAWATAYGIRPQLSSDNSPNPVIEDIGGRMDVDVAACWRPTAANYWGTVTKTHIAAVASEIIGDEFADERIREKKGEAAAAMELAFCEDAVKVSGLEKSVAVKTAYWLPKGMEFNEANFDDEPIIDERSDNTGDDGDLPAFLKDDQAA